jgi:hypothetical protein
MITSPENRLQHAVIYSVKRKTERRKNPISVYVVQCHNFVKIGIAEDVPNRISNLQTGCPYKLTLLKTWHSADAIAEEEALHERFGVFHVRGEWFNIPEEELALWLA